MRVVLQRVSRAHVKVEELVVGAIESGVVLLAGFELGDTQTEVDVMARKIAALRIFGGRTPMDLALHDVNGSCLVISQFTLAGRVDKGRRPSFDEAQSPDLARTLYESFCTRLAELDLPVATGIFGAHMEIEMVADGPVTLLLRAQGGSLVHEI
jgi:D-tyrosyl-tRNA(Tyr) deacylase